jgi:hypothetical protein
MPTFTPLTMKLPIMPHGCTLVDASWQRKGLTALFSFSGKDTPEPQAVRVIFKYVIVMRIVDEMTYSVEERGKDIFIAREGFAYEVADSPFLQTLTEAPTIVYKNPKQYTFFGQNDCMDVISSEPPQFDVTDLRPWLKSTGL